MAEDENESTDFAVVQNSSEITPRWMVDSRQPSGDETRVTSADSRKRSGPSVYGRPSVYGGP
ncbi:hypothetical protein Mal15_33660 [Stieleria maiorica]|uniref:Uncharacterized protein n=1 Tax=Stieleria maiorica TaxID=2795974 RepID=A0A5B9MDG7_9BACT|nr:hypothetical protein Mal15_33660 [Stieleria maiorica]